MMKWVALLYGFALPFTSVFALSEWINLPVLLGFIGLLALALKGWRRVKRFDVIVFATFVLPVIGAAMVNIEHLQDEKFLSHFLSYFVVFIIFYLVPRQLLTLQGTPLLTGVLGGLIVSVVFAYTEFALGAVFGYELLSYIPRIAVQEYDATFSGVLRVRSLAEESGHYALYLGVITPIVLLFIKNRWSKANYLYLLVGSAVAMVLTFSTSGIVFFLVSALIADLLGRRWTVKKVVRSVLILIVCWGIYSLIFEFSGIDLSSIVSDKTSDFNGRLEPFSDSWKYFQSSGFFNILFGLGPGYYSYRDLAPVISLPALTLFQNGVFGLLLYIGLFMTAFRQIERFSQEHKYLLRCAVVFAFLSYGGISNYWYPWFWFLLSVLSIGPSVLILQRSRSKLQR